MVYPRGTMILRATRGGPLARRGLRAASYHPYARYASRALSAYRYGKAAYPYVRAGVNMYKSRRGGRAKFNRVKKRAAMRRVGERVGTSSAKWDQLKVGLTNMSPQQLNQLPLLDVTKVSSTVAGNPYNRRLNDQLNFRGIKFCMNFRVEGAIGTAKAWMNIAVISPKSDLTSTSIIPNTEFFRHPTGDRRDIDFNDASLNNVDYRCCGINTDRYNVHKRQVLTMGPTTSTEGFKERYLEWYMPLKRQIRYQDSSQYPEGKNMYLVWWFSTSDAGTPANSVRFQYSVKRYFRDTQMT